MIVFDLRCRELGHVFEVWFGSSDDYESQCARGLVDCPFCGSRDIEKAVMAPRIGAKGGSRPAPKESVPEVPHSPAASTGVAGTVAIGVQLDATAAKAMIARLAKAQAKLLEGSAYVGRRFADEARSMHFGESEHRAIHGQATPAEARALIDDGVPVAPLPLPTRPPGADN